MNADIKNKKTRINIMVRDFKKNKTLLLLAFPMILYVFIFKYIPMFGIIIAFKNFKYNLGFFKSPWVGFKNFQFFFTSPDAWLVTRNTVGYNLVFITLGIIVQVGVAILLFEIASRKLHKIYQTLMFIPHLLSWVVVAYMAYAFLSPSGGMLNRWLSFFNIEPVDWYITPKPWIFIFPIANMWHGLGMGALMYYAKLMGINNEYFEAAEIEGASKWQITKNITLPFLYSLIIMLTILAIGRIFDGDFGLFYQLPMGSPMLRKTTDIIDTYVYRALVDVGNVGIASALGLYRSLMGMILVIVTNMIVRKIDEENALF
ncbi:MAG TPA: ABC transporter permease subunit [Clostridiales bacterium]|nr:ABC transporter permease subunit [Clostridiales bacterium]